MVQLVMSCTFFFAYKHLMQRWQQASPEETLFIDDSPKNSAVAQSLGIHTLCPKNNEDWTPSLKSYLKI